MIFQYSDGLVDIDIGEVKHPSQEAIDEKKNLVLI